jgi:hypothetical protein
MGRYAMNSNGPSAEFEGRSTARTSRERWLVALGGVLAGLAAFGIGEATYQIFQTVLVEQSLQGTKIWVPSLATTSAAVAKNGALAIGTLGVCLGLCLGAAGASDAKAHASGPQGRTSWRGARIGRGRGTIPGDLAMVL